MLLTQIVRTIHLILNVAFLSYFTGLLWFIICEITTEYYSMAGEKNFIHEFGLDN